MEIIQKNSYLLSVISFSLIMRLSDKSQVWGFLLCPVLASSQLGLPLQVLVSRCFGESLCPYFSSNFIWMSKARWSKSRPFLRGLYNWWSQLQSYNFINLEAKGDHRNCFDKLLFLWWLEKNTLSCLKFT